MSGLKYIKIPVEFYSLDITDVQRAILSLVLAFGETGLKMSNQSLADIFGKSSQWISEQISGLLDKGYVEIKNKQSKYRVIYFQENLKVDGNLLSSLDGLLSSFTPPTFKKTLNINKRKENNNKTSSSSASGGFTDEQISEFLNTQTHEATLEELEARGII